MYNISRLLSCALIVMLATAVAKSEPYGSIKLLEPYSIEGLAVGAQVAGDSKAYKRYRCKDSDQYSNSIACKLTKTARGETKIVTILHLYNDTVTYVNKSVFPAVFTSQEIRNEIGRLTIRFNKAPRLVTSSEGIIASWGDIRLLPLSRNDLSELAQDGNPNLGYLVDFRMNFHESARAGLPVFRLGGGKGYVWIARYAGENGEGVLRFLAADPSQMMHISAASPSLDDRHAPPPIERMPPRSSPAPSDREPACQKYQIGRAHV